VKKKKYKTLHMYQPGNFFLCEMNRQIGLHTTVKVRVEVKNQVHTLCHTTEEEEGGGEEEEEDCKKVAAEVNSS